MQLMIKKIYHLILFVCLFLLLLLLLLFATCSTGWLAEGLVVTPMQRYHEGCYGAGLNPSRPDEKTRWDAYCIGVN